MNKKVSIFITIISVVIALIFGYFISGLLSTNDGYTLTLINPEGETITPQSFDQAYDLELPEVTKEGYTFLGWFEGDSKVEEGRFDRSLTLIAKFEKNLYTLTFSSTDTTPLSVFHGQSPFLPVPDKVGYVFLGWYEDVSLTNEFDGVVTSSLTLYPKYEALGNNRFAHYYLSEFDGLVLDKVVEKDTNLELPTLAEDGYTFIGWRRSDTNVMVSSNDIINQNVVLIAVFEPLVKTFTVSFDTGSADPIDPIEVTEGEVFNLPLAPELAGYQFIGWIKDIAFDGFNVSSTLITEAFEVYEDVTLFANFDYMIPSVNIFYEPFRFGRNLLGYSIKEITFETDDVIDYMILPQTYLGLPVVSIENYAFAYLSYLKEVVVPEGYIQIGSGAFSYSSIEIIHLPQSLEVITSYSFEGSDIHTVHFAENSQLKSINEAAFQETEALKHIDIPSSVLDLGNNAFSYSALETITFAEDSRLRLLGRNSFNSTGLTEIDLPESLEIIGDNAFFGTKLTSIRLKENVREIKYRAFGETLIENVTFDNPNNIERLGQNIFEFTPIMEEEGILIIDNLLFGYDRNLNQGGFDVIIPETVDTFAEYAFLEANINTLTFETNFVKNFYYAFSSSRIQSSFVLPDSNVYTNMFSFGTLTADFEIILGTSAHDYNQMFINTTMEDVDVVFNGHQVDARKISMFNGTNAGSVTLGEQFTTIDLSMFDRTNLDHFEVFANTIYVENNGLGFNSLTTFDYPEDFEFIPLGDQAFADLYLKPIARNTENGYVTFANILLDTINVVSWDIVIPEGITVINTNAIARNFYTIEFNDTKYILRGAFQRSSINYNLVTIDIPSTVLYTSPRLHNDIGWGFERNMSVIFEGFTNEIVMLHANEITKSSSFYSALPFDQHGFKRIGNFIFDYDVENFGKDVVIPEGITHIANDTFKDLDITSITYITPIEYIGSNAFRDNNNLENLIIPNRTRDFYQIYGSYESNVTPTFDGLESIDFRSFYIFDTNDFIYANNLKPDSNGLIIHDGILLRFVGMNKDVVIPEGVIVISDYAFSETVVETITLPDSLKAIMNYAFSSTPRLHTLHYSDNLTLTFMGENVINGSLLSYRQLPENTIYFSERFFSYFSINFTNND